MIKVLPKPKTVNDFKKILKRSFTHGSFSPALRVINLPLTGRSPNGFIMQVWDSAYQLTVTCLGELVRVYLHSQNTSELMLEWGGSFRDLDYYRYTDEMDASMDSLDIYLPITGDGSHTVFLHHQIQDNHLIHPRTVI